MTYLKLKRAYDPESPSDGFRVYIDRLWPRGLSHETFHYDAWDKEIAPTDALRHQFHENSDANWSDFEKEYVAELKANPKLGGFVDELSSHPVVTLIYSSRNESENNAQVLRDFLVSTYPSKFKTKL